MAIDLTFQQVNNLIPDLFIFEGSTIKLDLSKLTGDTYNSLNNNGVLELCYKLLTTLNTVQIAVNQGDPTPLRSFSNPLFGTVRQGNPPTIQATVNFVCNLPLDTENLRGVN